MPARELLVRPKQLEHFGCAPVQVATIEIERLRWKLLQ
jgi:hypothetical protein